jgi:HEAT repeat protein
VVWVLLGPGGWLFVARGYSGAMNFSVWAHKGGQVQKMVDQAEIYRKVMSGEDEERRKALELFRDNFADLPDKEKAWKDLYWLTWDVDWYVRWRAADALGTAFQHVADKERAWKDLHRLTQAKDSDVRIGAADALGTAFQHVPDKEQAWNDLIQLRRDKDSYVRIGAADALGTAFQHVPDKEQAWNDLIRLTQDEDIDVRWGIAGILGDTFPHVSDKEQACKDLHRLTEDEDGNVRASANHSLGRASIFKATEAESEDDFKSELKNALEFFERSSNEPTHFNPSRFCLPFYRSFYTITFGEAGAEDEVQKYLAEAKRASGGSKSKEILLEAIANLANALSEAQKVTDFGAIKSDLNIYRRYCNRAADLIGDVTEGAPGAARVLRRGFPRINDQTKELIPEVQETAEAVCRETRGTGTPYESLGMEVNKWAGELSDRDYLRNERTVSRIIEVLGKCCNHLPEGEKEYPCNIVKEIREESKHRDKLSDILTVLSYLEPCIGSQLQNATKPTTDKTISDEQPSQKTSHSTTVFAGAGSTVVVPHTETESGAVTVNTAATKESQPDRSSKRTAIEISADIAVHVLVYTVLHHFAEDLMPIIAPILVISALIILALIIRNAKSR